MGVDRLLLLLPGFLIGLTVHEAAHDKGAAGEIDLTDAMCTLLETQPFYAVKYEGRAFDCGSKVGFLAANVAYALARPDLADAVAAEIKKLS